MPDLIATAAFGLEAVVGRELERLGYSDRVVEDGRVTFAADEAGIPRANLWLRSADRVLMQVGEFSAVDFGELFDRVEAIAWEDWLPRDAAVPVEVRAVRSRINSPRSGQGIVKKAIVTRLGRAYGMTRLPETGPAFPVDVSIRGDAVSVAIDTSGEGLHKRGYRTLSGPAPLKETLAAGLIQLSYWNRERPFGDPFCGTGTLPIEAALIGRDIAPGLSRTFLAEAWPRLGPGLWAEARDEARSAVVREPIAAIRGSDLDPKSVGTATRHAAAAGVGGDVSFAVRPFGKFAAEEDFGCLVTNPPYGERIGERDDLEAVYREMNEVFGRLPTWSMYVLTAFAGFERIVRRRPDRKRKLYNGRIECGYYQFYGPRPPRGSPVGGDGGSGVDRPAGKSDDGHGRLGGSVVSAGDGGD